MYTTFKFLHVASAIVWIGSGVGIVALFGVMYSAGDRATELAAGPHVEKLGQRLFGPAAMSTLLFGILAVIANDSISFNDTWIVIGFGGVALSLVILALDTPVTKQIGPAVAEHGPDSEQVDGLLARTRLLNSVTLVLLFIVVWAMVAKPGA